MALKSIGGMSETNTSRRKQGEGSSNEATAAELLAFPFLVFFPPRLAWCVTTLFECRRDQTKATLLVETALEQLD